MKLKRTLLATSLIFISSQSFAEEPTTLPEGIPPVNPAPGAAVDGEYKIDQDDKGIFSLVWENDIFSGQDQNYTNGVRFAYLSPEANAPEWLEGLADWLPLAGDGNKRYSIAGGQSLFTPDDIKTAALLPDQRPYAGWLYGSVGALSDTGKTLDNVMLTVGIVGPAALGEETQEAVHHWLPNNDDPKGWDNQLQNEVGINLDYERKWRSMFEFSPFGTGVDITPHVAASLGNVTTQATAGATLRIGYDLPQDYGPPRIRPSMPGSDFFIPTKDIGGYLFATVEGRAVARNIFLDGNTFRDSHSVDKENFVGSLSFGAAITLEDTRISYTHVLMSEEFETQDEPASFGVVTVSTRF